MERKQALFTIFAAQFLPPPRKIRDSCFGIWVNNVYLALVFGPLGGLKARITRLISK